MKPGHPTRRRPHAEFVLLDHQFSRYDKIVKLDDDSEGPLRLFDCFLIARVLRDFVNYHITRRAQ